MYGNKKVAVIIPALNENESLPLVLAGIPAFADRIIVADNGSTDATADIARGRGAEVVREERRGYGWACMKAMEALGGEDIVVFLDGDYSDDPSAMELLVEPIAAGRADAVISNRFTPAMEKGSMSPPQRFGNRLSVLLIRLLWGFRYRDLGPFRAIARERLMELGMGEMTFGWTIELQIKALQRRLRVVQVDVPYRKRARGTSKVSGTVAGVFGAGWRILWCVAKFKAREMSSPRGSR